jgi:hypothetical protein
VSAFSLTGLLRNFFAFQREKNQAKPNPGGIFDRSAWIVFKDF